MMERHITDPVTQLPPGPRPSRLDVHPHASIKRKSMSIAQGRGTMSMPSSPLRTGGNDESFPWNEGPQTAQAFFTPPGFAPFASPQEGWFPPPSTVNYVPPSFFSSSERSSTPPQLDLVDPIDDERADEHEYREDGMDVPPPRKKRAQVRVACTHCQKACKKCSNTRPCDRCVKYGFKDCVDSTRKPRKTGIKRGPYKRRTSAVFPNHHQPPFPIVHAPAQTQPMTLPVHPPPARPLANLNLTQAFAAAFERGPRWMNGQRQDQPAPHPPPPPPPPPPPEPMMGRRPSLPPPIIGLSGLSQDPFSRAVSPIGHRFSVGTDYFKSADRQPEGPLMGVGMGMGFVPPPLPRMNDSWVGNPIGTGQSTPSSTGGAPGQAGVSVIDYAYPPAPAPAPAPAQTQVNQAFFSLPPSPKSLPAEIGDLPRPSSAGPIVPFTPTADSVPVPVQPPFTSGLGRRPSLQLFMCQSQPQPIFPWTNSASRSGEDSPTLFDGPMDHDEQWK